MLRSDPELPGRARMLMYLPRISQTYTHTHSIPRDVPLVIIEHVLVDVVQCPKLGLKSRHLSCQKSAAIVVQDTASNGFENACKGR